MDPKAHFDEVWLRCGQLTAAQAYVVGHAPQAIDAHEILRAEWVARVSALDLYVHELVAQRMAAIFQGARIASRGYNRFKLSNDVVARIRLANTPVNALSAFDLEVRTQLSLLTFQDPEKIADAIRMFSDAVLWEDIAVHYGATPRTKKARVKSLKADLSAVVERRNKIAHEGDLQPIQPRTPYPISSADLNQVRTTIETVVNGIHAVIA